MGDGIGGAIGTGLGAVVTLNLAGLLIKGVGELGDTLFDKGEPGLSDDFKAIDID